ncbi:MAG: GNAT family N-acetyltransferase [Paracoccaceae bacterium]
MIEIRRARPEDLDAYYRISLLTGDRGGDATQLYRRPRLMGQIYSAPYLLYSPALCLSLVADGRVAGYCVGAADTDTFASVLERDWWPPLRAAHPMPDIARRDQWTVEERRIAAIHRPKRPPRRLVECYPAHVHLNLLPECQGKGWGARLLREWFSIARVAGVGAVHLGANPGNSRAIAFWNSQSFEHVPVDGDSRTYWMAQKLPSA